MNNISSHPITIARPYAQAAFNFAVEHGKISVWQHTLKTLATVAQDKDLLCLAKILSRKSYNNLFMSICESVLDNHTRKFVSMLIENNRLYILPHIFDLFLSFRFSKASTMRVSAFTASLLNENQVKSLTTFLEKYFLRKISLQCTYDKKLLGGIVLRFGDTVIDGSVRNKLKLLEKRLNT